MVVPVGATWCFDAMVVGRNSTGISTGFEVKGLIKNVAGVTSLVGTPSSNSLGSDPGTAGWNVTVTAGPSVLVVKVTGDSSTIRWVANVHYRGDLVLK